MEFAEPANLAAAQSILIDDSTSKIMSGGTALVLMMQQGLVMPSAVVSVRRISGLGSVSEDGGWLTLGSQLTLSEIASDLRTRQVAPSLAYACSRVGNIRIRNAATVGGNMAEADYASDPPAVLVSLGARVRIATPSGDSRLLSAEEFITGFYETDLAQGEIVTSIEVPIVPDRRCTYLKYISRSSEDRPCVGVAAAATMGTDDVSDLRVVVGAVAGTPQYLPEITEQVIGRRLSPRSVRAIARDYADAIDPLDDMRGSSWYRREMIAVFVQRALDRLAAEQGSTNE